MSNLFVELIRLLPSAPLLVGTVDSTFTGGAVVVLQGGGVLRARGAATVGQQVFVRDGVIEGVAPSLALVEIEV